MDLERPTPRQDTTSYYQSLPHTIHKKVRMPSGPCQRFLSKRNELLHRYPLQSKARSTLQNSHQSTMPPLWGA
eukprot:1161354-Pelagomonas_calceolata.AAC.10